MERQVQIEKRQFHRVVFTARAELRQGAQVWNTELLDLSLKGALIRMPIGFDAKMEQPFILSFNLEGLPTSIIMQGLVSHMETDRIGFATQHFDIDSATELRRLIELNLQDEALLERDIHALCEDNRETLH